MRPLNLPLPLYLSEAFGANKQTIGLCLAGYTVMALLVRPFSGYVVDNFPRKAVLLICNFAFFALFAGYLVAGSITLFTIFYPHMSPYTAKRSSTLVPAQACSSPSLQ